MSSIMLALSTFRQSEKAVKLAIKKVAKGKTLIAVFIVDVNLAHYLACSDVGFYPELKAECEKELLEEHKEEAEKRLKSIIRMANRRGITVRRHLRVGRFDLECLKIAKKDKPKLIITTRSKRPAWVRRFFGSPVDHLIANVGCPVIEA